MTENIEGGRQPQSESETRLAQLNIAVESLRERLSDEERAKVKAIILYGSIARGEATSDSDIDVHVDLDPYDNELFKKIIDGLSEQFPDTGFSVSSKNIVDGGRVGRLITSQKSPNTPASWKFLYSRSDTEQQELDAILTKEQSKRK